MSSQSFAAEQLLELLLQLKVSSVIGHGMKNTDQLAENDPNSGSTDLEWPTSNSICFNDSYGDDECRELRRVPGACFYVLKEVIDPPGLGRKR
jgi:hypothetical protein